MRLFIWWMSRLKRSLPYLLVILLFVFASYKLLWQRDSQFKGRPIAVAQSHHVITQSVTKPVAVSVSDLSLRWIVVTFHGAKCDQLVLDYSQWTILIVGGEKAERYSHSHCQFLSDNDMQDGGRKAKLPAELQDSLAVAYLRAIEGGAKWIFVLREERYISDFASILSSRGVVYSTKNTIFQAASHFGCNTSTTRNKGSRYDICRDTRTVISARADCWASNVAILCDKHIPGVTLKQEVFAAVSLSDALFYTDAFWALPLARTQVDENVVWLLAVQRLIWLLGGRIHVDRCTRAKLWYSVERLLTRSGLTNWQCSTSTFHQCVSAIIKRLSAMESAPDRSTQTWIDTLVNHPSYKFPNQTTLHAIDCSSNELLLQPVVHSVPSSGRHIPVSNINSIRALYNKTCNGETVPAFSKIDLSRPWMQFGNILLIVVFNNPIYSVIPYLELLYRPFFPNVLYCGPTRLQTVVGYRVSFVAYGPSPTGHVSGALSYRCMTLAIDAAFRVDGYLIAADDLLLQIHTLESLNRASPWFLSANELRVGELRSGRECKLGMCDAFAHWLWWDKYRDTAINALTALRDSSKSRLRQCHRTLVTLNGAENRANGGFSDIYYIPRRLAAHFLLLADVFLHHNVFVEIAVPTILRCLAAPGSIVPLRGEVQWMNVTRDEPWRFFKTKYLVGKAYMHPTKWRDVATSPKRKTLYCSKVLPFFHDRFARIIKD